jgi:mannose-1-phosphate guanylyltransferase
MSTHPAPVYALILAGGAGTRFWPASRAARPKQLLPLLGGDPLILETAKRVLPLSGGWSRIAVASGSHLAKATAAALPDLPEENLLVEPVPRNTAPCIGWAAAWLARRSPEAVMMVLPSDHAIVDVPRFQETLARAVASAQRGVITTVGIQPTHPETGYGYIEVEGTVSEGEAQPVKRFVEKPPRAKAEEFVASGRYLWNAGMFFFRAKDMVAAIQAHLPALAEGLDVLDRAASAGREAEELARVFPGLPSVSIDKGVMEHVGELAVVPGDFGWNDVGSWESAHALAVKDERGNSAPAGAVLLDARNNHVVDLRDGGGKKRVIALLGVEDLVVVETEDALLVMPRGRAQDVKEVVDLLKKRGDGGLT